MKIKMNTPQIEYCVDQLLVILDSDIQQLEQNITRLNTLRSLLIRQDKNAMEQLLQTIRSESAACRKNDMSRQCLRQQLAGLWDCSPQEITLSYLLERFTEYKKSEIAKRKNTLQTLSEVLRREYSATQMLLADCARFNRLLLNSLFQTVQSGNLTYKATGMTQRQTDTMLMNMQF